MWRAAAFLWMIFLSAMESMTLVEARNWASAAALSPAATALRTFLMAVRRRERRLLLCAFSWTAWRARLRAYAMFAMERFPQRARGSGRQRNDCGAARLMCSLIGQLPEN